MAKFFAWCLFLLSSAMFIGNLALQQYVNDQQEQACHMSQPLPDMLRFQQACNAGDDAVAD